jgi:hypothetical protein
VIVVDAVDRLSGDQLHTLCAAWNASRRARNPQREHFGKPVNCRKLVASPSKSAKLADATYGGKKMSSRFTQYILIAMALGIVMGSLVFNFMPDSRVKIPPT